MRRSHALIAVTGAVATLAAAGPVLAKPASVAPKFTRPVLLKGFGGGEPWVTLDLADGDTLAVMAIQRADGEDAVAEARRLATLVDVHSRTDRDD